MTHPDSVFSKTCIQLVSKKKGEIFKMLVTVTIGYYRNVCFPIHVMSLYNINTQTDAHTVQLSDSCAQCIASFSRASTQLL